MDISRFQDTRTLNSTWQLIIAAAIGVLLGSITYFLPPVWVAVFVGGFAILLIVVKRPEIALLGVVIFLATLLPEENIPVINIGPGRLYITEPIIIGLGLFVLLKWIVRHESLVSTPLDLPIIGFYIWAVLSTIISIYVRKNNDISLAIPEIRYISYYLVFFVVTNLVRKNQQVKLLLDGLFLLGTVVAAAMIVQYIFGTTFTFISGRVEALYTAGSVYEGVTRITDTVGEGLITVAFIVKSVSILMSDLKWKKIRDLIQWLLLGVAVGMTYSRTHWIMAGIAIVLTIILGTAKDRFRILRWSLITALVLPVILFMVMTNPESESTRFISSTIDRFTTILEPESYRENTTSTLRWRDFEYAYGIPTIGKNPILGIGLGAFYRPFLYGIDWERFDGRDYTHNGHLWIAMKTGLVGYFFFLWFSLMFLWRGFKNWRKIVEPNMRSIYLGFTLAYLGVLIGSITHPIVMTIYWTPLIGLMLGVNEVILKINKEKIY